MLKLHEIARFVDDVDTAAAFYEALLGGAPVQRNEEIAIFDLGGITLLIHRRYDPGPDDLPCEDHIAFAVDDLDEAVRRLWSRGMSLERAPRQYEWGRSAYLRDPAGRLVELTADSDPPRRSGEHA